MKSQLLRPFPISNPPLLRIKKDYPPASYQPYEWSQFKGEWVVAIIYPMNNTAQHQDIVQFRNDIWGFTNALYKHFIKGGATPPHTSFLRLDDMEAIEYYDTMRMFGLGSVYRSIAITSPYFNGHGNTYSAPFMQWIQRTDEMAQKGRDKFQVYNRLDHIEETYPITILIDPLGYVQGYWRSQFISSYSTYQMIRTVQKAQEEAKRMQPIYDGTSKTMTTEETTHE
jgi:peroxiredoxin